MTTEIVEINPDGEVKTEIIPTDIPTDSDSVMTHDAAKSSEEWQSLQAKTAVSLSNATSYITAFFKNNQQLLTALGWVLLAFLGTRLLFAGLDAIDDIPLVTPILKLIGLVYLVRFVWRYLIRESDRQELIQALNRAKTEIFGIKS